MPAIVLGLEMQQRAKQSPCSHGTYILGEEIVFSMFVHLYCQPGTPVDKRHGFTTCFNEGDHTPPGHQGASWYQGVKKNL